MRFKFVNIRIPQVNISHNFRNTIVNDIRNFVFGLAGAAVYGFCKSRKQKFVMLFINKVTQNSKRHLAGWMAEEHEVRRQDAELE